MNFLKNFLSFKKYQYKKYKKYNFRAKRNNTFLSKIKELNKNGYMVIENFFDLDTCKKIQKIIDKFILKNPKMVWRDHVGADIRIFGAEHVSLEMKNLVERKINFTLDIGKNYLNQQIALYMMMANRIKFKSSNLGSGQGWHKDSYSKQFKSIIYLNDVNDRNGPLQIIKNSNTDLFMLKMFYKLKNKYPSTRFSSKDIKKILNNNLDNVIELKGKAGTLIIFDTSNIHRGKPLKENTRYALTNYFYPKIDFKNHKNHFLPMLKKLQKL
jgi:hypothetical protein